MKSLTAFSLDSGNCRAYFKDEKNRSYVLLDQGHSFEKAGLPRFELYNHSSCGEPDCPISISWIIKEGIDGSVFKTGLSYIYKSERACRVLQLMDSNEDGASRFSEFVKTVSKETGVSVEQIELELEPFI